MGSASSSCAHAGDARANTTNNHGVGVDAATVRLYHAFQQSLRAVRSAGQSHASAANHRSTFSRHIANVDEVTRSSDVLALVVSPAPSPVVPGTPVAGHSRATSASNASTAHSKLLARFVWNLELLPPLPAPPHLDNVEPVPADMLVLMLEATSGSPTPSTPTSLPNTNAPSSSLLRAKERKAHEELVAALANKLAKMDHPQRIAYQHECVEPLALGIYYHDQNELEVAAYYFSVAAALGNSVALHLLAISTRHGLGVPSDMTLAVHLLQLSIRAAVGEILLGSRRRQQYEATRNPGSHGVSGPPETLERIISENITRRNSQRASHSKSSSLGTGSVAMNKMATFKMQSVKQTRDEFFTAKASDLDQIALDAERLQNESRVPSIMEIFPDSNQTIAVDNSDEIRVSDTKSANTLSVPDDTRPIRKFSSSSEQSSDSISDDNTTIVVATKSKKGKSNKRIIPKPPKTNNMVADTAISFLGLELCGDPASLIASCTCRKVNCICQKKSHSSSNQNLELSNIAGPQVSLSESFNAGWTATPGTSDSAYASETCSVFDATATNPRHDDFTARNEAINKIQLESQLTLTIFEIGVSFLHGWGVQRSKRSALYYLSLAAQLGDADAQELVGGMYLRGIGCRASKPLAAYWFRSAIRNGNKILGTQWVWKEKYDAPDDIRDKRGRLINEPPGVNSVY